MLENITENITTVNIMKYGWHQTVNNVACCYQTPFNIAIILEQKLNYSNVLREQVNIKHS